jgi:predicted RecB family nuclease
LIGVLVGTEKGVRHHNLWADEAADEERIWRSFLDILSEIDNPVLLHYGNFEKTFLKKMSDRYGYPPEDSAVGKAVISSINLLSVIFAQVYFPS